MCRRNASVRVNITWLMPLLREKCSVVEARYFATWWAHLWIMVLINPVFALAPLWATREWLSCFLHLLNCPLSRVVCRIFCCYSACQRSVDPTAARHHPCSFLQSDFLSPINVLLFSPAAVTESPALFPVVKARCLVTAKGGVFIAEGAFCSRPRGSFPPP